MPHRRPNFVIFQAEDTGRQQRCYGDPCAHTPHIDRLASQGCRFTNAFTVAPVCAPSRSCMVTGRYPTEIGNHLMRSTLTDPPKLVTEVLREQGYYVNWANKTDFNLEPPETFADDRTFWLDELENDKRPEQPFCLYYNFGPTHESVLWPPDAKPGLEPPVEEPGYGEDRHGGVPVPPYLPDTPVTRSGLRRHYDRVALQDHYVGRVMSMLEWMGLAEDTIFIFLSDHGRGGPREKRWVYEAGIHLPLIIRWPGRVRAGTVREDLISWVDLAPTILDLAGIDRGVAREQLQMPGRVFLDDSGDAPEPEPGCVFAGTDRQGDAGDRSRAARDRRYLYIRNDFPNIPYAQRNWYQETSPILRQMRHMDIAGELTFPANVFMADRKPTEELYDTVVDPHCVINLVDRPEMSDVLDRLRREMDPWRQQYDQRGQLDERELIQRGVIQDQIQQYADRYGTLPEPLNKGGRYNTHQFPADAPA